MRMMTAAAALGAVIALAAPAHAEAGKWQVKLLGTAVLPDGKIDQVKKDLIGVPAGTDTRANDNYVPTVAIEYFFSEKVSVETICCVTQHDVDVGAGPLTGAEMVSNAKIVPATFTLKYHFGDGSKITPYVGAGPAYFLVLGDKPGTGAVGLGATDFSLDDSFGLAVQAGLDIPVGKDLFLSLDAKRYFISADAHWFAGATEVLVTEHQLDPWVLSAGVGFAF